MRAHRGSGGCDMPLACTDRQVEAAAPDLIFNTAEGVRGKTREALYPQVFEELGIPYTGSDGWTLAVTLDKHLTKALVEPHQVRVPRHVFRNSSDRNGHYCTVPCIVKPNYEGSSKGVHEASVVTDSTKLEETIQRVLRAYPEGLTIEEYIAGIDVTVGWFEGLGSEVLTPCCMSSSRTGMSLFRFLMLTWTFFVITFCAIAVVTQDLIAFGRKP